MRSELKSGTQDTSGAEVVSVHEGASSLGRAKLRFEAACNEPVEEQPTFTKFVPKLGATQLNCDCIRLHTLALRLIASKLQRIFLASDPWLHWYPSKLLPFASQVGLGLRVASGISGQLRMRSHALSA